MNLPEEDHRKIIEWAKRHSEIKRVYLYGSRARGDNKPESDIDLGIEMHASDAYDAYSAWSNWHSEYEKNPDLHLSVEVHLQWYQAGADLERVGAGVERDGIILFSTD